MDIYRAKVFQNGGSQAIRLPKELRFEGQDAVKARREGDKVILEPLDEWPQSWLAVLGSWDEEIERPEGDRPRDPFE